jgi:hypothetical protein
LNAEAGKMKKVAVILLWLSLLIVKDAASAFQEQPLPTGVARVYGYAHYMETIQLSQPIRRAKVEHDYPGFDSHVIHAYK